MDKKCLVYKSFWFIDVWIFGLCIINKLYYTTNGLKLCNFYQIIIFISSEFKNDAINVNRKLKK